MTTQTGQETGRNSGVNALCGANGSGLTIGPRACPACLKSLEGRRRGTRYCHARCRLLYWTVQELSRALASGHAEGLRGELRKMAEAA